MLIGGTVLIAAEAELVSDAVEATATQPHVSPAFLGMIVLALVGTSADLFAAVAFGRQDRMSIVFSICVGSAIQMSLVVAPLLVLVSWLIGHPMNLAFDPLELFAIARSRLHRARDRGRWRDELVRGLAADRRLRAARACRLFRRVYLTPQDPRETGRAASAA